MSPMARSLGWHSRSNVTPYFLQASRTGPKRSTSSSKLTSRTSGILCPPMSPGGGGHFAVLRFAEIVSEANDGQQIARGRLVDKLAYVVGNVIRIGARRIVAF